MTEPNRTMSRTLIVTGGACFIGSNFVHTIHELRPDWRIVNLDALTTPATSKT